MKTYDIDHENPTKNYSPDLSMEFKRKEKRKKSAVIICYIDHSGLHWEYSAILP